MMRKSTARFRNILAKFMVLALVLTLVGVVTSTTAEAAAKPAISKAAGSVLVGKKLDLNIKNQVKDSTYTWKTSSKKIATVDKKGIVTGIAKGTVTITCQVKTPKVTYNVTSKITVRTPASSVAVSNKVTALNAGQTYSLKTTVKPAASNDVVTWSSSNAKVLKVTAAGKLTAVKKGTATLTGRTLSGKSVKLAVMVTDEAGTVTTQKELDSLLGSGAALITLKTDAEAEFTVNEGDYTTQKLVVDAPKADVVNNGTFKGIEIKAIKAATWTENASGNVLDVTAENARIIISEKAVADLVLNNVKAVLDLVNNGSVKSLVLDNASAVKISGTSKDQITVIANAAGTAITSSLPLNLTVTAKIKLELLKGAENTKVAAETEALIPTVTGNVQIVVTIGKEGNTTTKTVTGDGYTAVPSGGGGSSGGGGGGGSEGGGTNTPAKGTYTIKGTNGVFKLPDSFKRIKNVDVKYGNFTYTVTSSTLSDLVAFLNDEDNTYAKWVATTNTKKTYQGQEVTVTGDAGSEVKTVKFSDGELGDRTYSVTVTSDDNVTVKRAGSDISYTLNKQDNRTLRISNAPSDLYFVVTY